VGHLAYVCLPLFSRFSRLTRRFEDRASQISHSSMWCSSRGSLTSAKKGRRAQQRVRAALPGTAGDTLSPPQSSASASTSVTAATSAHAVTARPSGSSGGDSAGGRIGVDTVWVIGLDLNSPSPQPAPVRQAPARGAGEPAMGHISSGHQLAEGGKRKWNGIPIVLPRRG